MKVLKRLFIAAVLIGAITQGVNAYAGATVKGYLKLSVHYVSILKDSALAYTSISRPTSDEMNSPSVTTVKIYNKSGDYQSATYSLSDSWDLPINAGATAKIRAAKKATSTHKAKSYDTGYAWVTLNKTVTAK